jgi:hypothetical protein
MKRLAFTEVVCRHTKSRTLALAWKLPLSAVAAEQNIDLGAAIDRADGVCRRAVLFFVKVSS